MTTGRPPDDRLARQNEIYQAVAPLLIVDGPQRLSMEQAAYAACLSIGGLYPYFPTKEALVLHGLAPDPTARLGRVIRADLADLPRLEQRVDRFVERAHRVCAFFHPSVLAALELGPVRVQYFLGDWPRPQVAQVAQILPLVVPGTPRPRAEAPARALTSVAVKPLLSPQPDFHELRDLLRLLLGDYLSRARTDERI